jgi:NitT/TauT family transport system substrate-binding protein
MIPTLIRSTNRFHRKGAKARRREGEMTSISSRLRAFAVVFLLALVVPTIAGCGKSESTASPSSSGVTSVKLQLNWKPEPQFGGFYTAKDSGAYAKHSLDVTVSPGGSGAPTVDMLGAGTVEFAIVSGDEIARARANGNKLVALFAVYQTNPQGIMTRASRGFKEIGDVFKTPGTLAMEKGLPYSDFLKNKYGFDKLMIVPSPFGDLSLYRTKEDYAMQCFVTSEPLAAKKTGIEPRTFLIADSGYNPYTTVLATTDAFHAKNPRVVDAMVKAVREGWEAYLADPSKTNDAMHKLNETMSPETFTESAEAQKPLIETDETKANGLGTMTPARWETLVAQLKSLGALSSDVKAPDCFVAPSK